MPIGQDVKLVIWDLDDTFWQGTLSEGGVLPIAENSALVRELAQRGIVSSICSKNDPQAVEALLRHIGIWEHFVFPSVAFRAKGGPIAALVAALNLRPDNVVFIDDNPSVLAEAAFACPGLQCLDSPAALRAAMAGPFLRGKPDDALTRLAQYHQLAARHDQRGDQPAGNEDFLRQSEIRIAIDYAVEDHIERIVELINRSNQLNYTKVRLVSDEDRARFVASLTQFGFKPGVVRAWDRYGDYGVVGFFLTLATLREYKLEHFVFSCRVMDMGIEQYVYDYLKRPALNIVAPVANGLNGFAEVDWIAFGSSADVVDRLRDFDLVLIGGCDMLQLSTYCSGRSTEFTNRDVGGIIKRLDDPFLIIDDPEAVNASPLRAQIPAFDHADMLELRDAVQRADAVIVSFYRMMEINYFRGRDGLFVRLDEDAVKAILASDRALWFIRNFAYVELAHEQRQELIRRALQQLAHLAKPGGKVIVILENTRKLETNPNEKALRDLYNRFVIDEARAIDGLEWIDINTVTNRDWLFDDGFHMSRQGYFELAEAVRGRIDESMAAA
jgi:FkbH-like protein